MSEASNESLSVEQVQALFDASPFISWLGLKVVAVDHAKSEIQVRMPLKPELERRPGTRQFHGGPIASFIDVVGDFAIGMLVGGGEFVQGTGRIRRAGKTAAVIDIDVKDDQGRLVAVGRGTYSSQRG
jgi:acyl-coenzyme A thioesterase PaaI-like protein